MRYWLGLGANLGDRRGALEAALAWLADAGHAVEAVSPVYETAPVGGPPQGDYLNACIELEWTDDPRELLEALLKTEQSAGRERGELRHSARTLDLDLLLCGSAILDEPELTLPHPRLHTRAFVLEPLCALAPELVHPLLGETLDTLRARVTDPEAVRAFAPASALEP